MALLGFMCIFEQLDCKVYEISTYTTCANPILPPGELQLWRSIPGDDCHREHVWIGAGGVQQPEKVPVFGRGLVSMS